MNRYKDRLQKCIDIVFPKYNKLFKTKYSKVYMDVLKIFGNSTAIANVHLQRQSFYYFTNLAITVIY